MNLIRTSSIALVLSSLGVLVGACSGTPTGSENVGTGSSDIVSPRDPASAAGATGPSAAAGPSAIPHLFCPVGEKECKVRRQNGTCGEVCVIDTALCVDPGPCAVCDPNGPQPRAGCNWSTTACAWECPVCDPVGTPPHAGCNWSTTACDWECPVCDPVGTPPRAGCTWSTTACEWECPVCDPPPPPLPQGCQWDGTACVWICG